MAEISKIRLPNLSEYNIKDTVARNSIPTNTSDLINDSGFITESSNITGTAAGLSETLGVSKGGTGLATMTNVNSVPVANGTSATGAMQAVRSASGAFYSTGQDVKPQFGTLPVAQGGTGKSVWSTNRAVITGSTATGAFTSRPITDNRLTSTELIPNTNLITENTLKNIVNRTTSVAAADTNYTTYMARGTALFSVDTVPANNGQIAWTYY